MNRLLAVHIRFSKYLLSALFFLTAGVSSAVFSQVQVSDLVAQGKSIRDTARLADLITPQDMTRANSEAKALLSQLEKTNQTMMDMKKIQKEKNQYSNATVLVFASVSLGDVGLNELFNSVSGLQDAVIIFRGIPEGMSLGKGVLYIQNLARQYNPMPNIVINPTLFKKHNVLSVPTMIIVNTESESEGFFAETIRVAGITDPFWLKKQSTQGSSGDLGIKGPIADISEPDLIEVAKKKMAGIDWEQKKIDAKNNFWKKQNFIKLSRATLGRTRMIDPTILIQKDIATPDGVIIAKQGDRINPLHKRTFTQALIVFDPTDREQVELVKTHVITLKQNHRIARINYIATRFNKTNGWDSYKNVTDEFDSEVFLLTPDVQTRFELQVVPSIITATADRFVIQELAKE